LLTRRHSCGQAFAPGDAAGLAATIARWQADATARTRLGANARAAYERHFTAAAALAGWESLLRRIAANPP
jgi:glycosyltransferase involved in cell wall biosynthesis